MATDEVRIILRGSSKQLEASLKRIEAGMRRIGVASATTNRAIQTGARRSAKSIDTQNKSLTLMVAKFALIAFAVQTLANIFNATFGAILRNIDDFQIAAIGTAAAITSLTDAGDRSVGDVFNQNLTFAIQTFEELELVAARFFSTGQELQLGFNTLAQKGVTVREEEFGILGRLVDQIKLLTGGQNAQIQIQQELRAILDGNVRTTTAFGKSLQQRGVDITQLSREVRATGSLVVFEQFLTGIEAASGAIRRTLTSVLATFSSLASIIGRRVFQDAFDGVVSTITTINNFLIDNLGLVVEIGRGISDRLVAAFQRAIEIAKQFGSIIVDIATSDVAKLIIAIKLIGLALSTGPLGFVFAIAAAFTLATGEIETFGLIIEIVFSALRLTLDFATKQLEKFFQGIKALGQIIRVLTTGDTELIGAFFDVRKASAALATIRNSIAEIQQLLKTDISEGRRKDLNTSLENLQKNEAQTLANLQKSVGELSALPAGQEFLGREIVNAASAAGTLADAIKNVRDGLKDLEKSQGIKEFDAQIDDIVEKLLSLRVDVPGAGKADATDTRDIIPSDTRVFEARRKEERRAEDEREASANKRRKAEEDKEVASIKKLLTEEKLTATEAFDQQAELREKSLQLDIASIEERVLLNRERLFEDQLLINEQVAATEGPTAITDSQEEELKRLKVIAKAQAANDKLHLEAAKLGIDLGKLDLENKEKLLAVQQEITDLIREQAEILNRQFGAETNEQRAARTQQAAEDSTTDFRQQFPGASNQQIIDQATLANTARVRENFKVQIAAFTGAIDKSFDSLTNALVEGSFEFRDLGQAISKDLIKAGLQGVITQIKTTIVDGLTSIFESVGQSIGQALTLALGLILAVISRIGSEGDFTASGAGGGSGVDSSSVPVRGLIGGDSSLPIAEINNGLLEALIPTNAILSQIEQNTRSLNGLNGGGIDLEAIIANQVNSIFEESLLNNA